MAKYDLPAMIEKALEVSKADTLYYVAHSMGTMVGFAQFSQDHNLAKKIKQFYAIGPVVHMNHVQGPVKYGGTFLKGPMVAVFKRIFGIDEFLPNTQWQQIFAKYVCGNRPTDLICKNLLLMISGPNTHQMNESRIPVINAHSPAGTSIQNVLHFGQLMNTGKFQGYDYGSPNANRIKYGTPSPPLYNLGNMNVPVAFYSSELDWLAASGDVAEAVSLVKNVIADVVVPRFNHMDFVWGLRAAEEVYQPILKSILKDFS